LRKANISFVKSVCPSLRPPAWSNSNPNGQIFMTIFRKSVEIVQVSLTCDNYNVCFTWISTYISDHISLSSS